MGQNQLATVSKLKAVLNEESVQTQFKNSLKENSGAFIASLIELYGSDVSLQAHDPKAVVMEALKAASLKLPINKNLGFAWIIVRAGKPCFDLGYKGYIQLAMRTGQYKTINANGVPGGMEVEEDLLTGEIKFSGTPISESTAIGYFAHFELINGFKKTVYWTRAKVEAHAKKYSKSYTSKWSPWKTSFDKMAIKTLIHELIGTYGIMSTEMMTAVSDQQNGYNDTSGADKALIDLPGEEVKAEATVTNETVKESSSEMPDIFSKK